MRIGNTDSKTSWLNDPQHLKFLQTQAKSQVAFFKNSLRADGGFDVLDRCGTPIPDTPQELHTTTRLVHSYCLAKLAGFEGCDDIIDAGMAFLWNKHRDTKYGGYCWSVQDDHFDDTTKLAYGHVFVLLAGASARLVNHPHADRLINDISPVLDTHYWEPGAGLLCDEYRQDWSTFSSYRGLNANMHGVEAMLSAFEATGNTDWLTRAGSILEFFVGKIATQHQWRMPEHYKDTWQIDANYSGNPMFRPAGSTPGHSFELARLQLQHWDLSGRTDPNTAAQARALIETAHADAWRSDGGYVYTLKANGEVDIPDRYWWPLTEAIGAYASLLKLDTQPQDETRYRQLWRFAANHFIDTEHAGWLPEIDEKAEPTFTQFAGKPDIYHALQATLFPAVPVLSYQTEHLAVAFTEVD